MSRPHTTSARYRPPSTGRSNMSSADINLRSFSPKIVSNQNTVSVDSLARTDSVNLSSRNQNNREEASYMHPVLPRSVTDPIIPVFEPEIKRYTRPLSCPQEWVTKLQEPDVFNKFSLSKNFDENAKRQLSRNFIERNRDRLWKIDIDYLDKTPRTVGSQIMKEDNFAGKMVKHVSRERILRLSSSDETKRALTNPYDYAAPSDPFRATCTTSRDERRYKMEQVLAPALLQHGHRHQRGYKHAIDFGNFSQYNGVLKVNQATTMNR